MIPTPGKGVDAVNFRSLKESESVDISGSRTPTEHSGDVTDKPEDVVDPFGEFNSGTPHSLPSSLYQFVGDVDDSDVTL
jgi:protein-serine/threonine kinase